MQERILQENERRPFATRNLLQRVDQGDQTRWTSHPVKSLLGISRGINIQTMRYEKPRVHPELVLLRVPIDMVANLTFHGGTDHATNLNIYHIIKSQRKIRKKYNENKIPQTKGTPSCRIFYNFEPFRTIIR